MAKRSAVVDEKTMIHSEWVGGIGWLIKSVIIKPKKLIHCLSPINFIKNKKVMWNLLLIKIAA